MKLSELKGIFLKIIEIIKEDPKQRVLNKKIKYNYGKIINELNTDLDEVVKSSYRQTAETLDMIINIPSRRERRKLIQKKIGGKTLFQRLKENANNLVTDIKKAKVVKNYSITKRIFQEYRRVKNTFKNERHRVFEMVKSNVLEEAKKRGIITRKKWHCQFRNSRDPHMRLHGKYADKDGYFYIDGYKTKYPGGFGIAKLDINCHCKVKVERIR